MAAMVADVVGSVCYCLHGRPWVRSTIVIDCTPAAPCVSDGQEHPVVLLSCSLKVGPCSSHLAAPKQCFTALDCTTHSSVDRQQQPWLCSCLQRCGGTTHAPHALRCVSLGCMVLSMSGCVGRCRLKHCSPRAWC